MQADETYGANSLIDMGPAPPLPDKSDFDFGPPAGGGGSYPPQAAPFTYPAPIQPQPPNPYPNGAAGTSSSYVYPGGAMGSKPGGCNQPPALNNLDKNTLGNF